MPRDVICIRYPLNLNGYNLFYQLFKKLLGERVRKSVISTCKNAKEFDMIVDTTLNAAHLEQMSHILRSADINQNSVYIKGAFVDFIPLEVKTAK